jgi:D-3-phosphoglycerate dehydrogenase
MVKILVLTNYSSEKLWEEAFKKNLKDSYLIHQFRYLNPRKGGPTFIGRQTKKVQGVREAIGDPEQLKTEIQDNEVLIVGFEPVTESVIELGNKLKLIASTRGGPVNVDINAAAKRGILVTHTSGRLAKPVSDHTMGLLLGEARNIARNHFVIKNRTFFSNPNVRKKWHKVPEMEGKTLGIIGFGNVGKEVAKRAVGFGLKILVHDPYVKEEDVKKLGLKLTSLETLMKESDFVTIHARETPKTFHLIGKQQLDLMKHSAYLINTSRGTLVDEKALYETLKEGKIAGAALDVYEQEPLKTDNPLINLDNITLTSHSAGGSDRANERSIFLTVKIVGNYLKGKKLTKKEIFDPDQILLK